MIRTDLGWVECSVCRVIQPLPSLEHFSEPRTNPERTPNGLRSGFMAWRCTDKVRCGRYHQETLATRLRLHNSGDAEAKHEK